MSSSVDRVVARHFEAALRPADKRVVDAFVRREAAEGRMLSTDGHSLYKQGIYGEKVAVWMGAKIAIVSTESGKSDEVILRYLVKVARHLVTWSYDRAGFEKSLTFSSGGDALYGGQYDAWIVAFVPGREEPVGRVDYMIFKEDGRDRYQIKFVDVDPDFRRSGVATALYRELFRKEGITKHDLVPATQTDEGHAFRQRALIARVVTRWLASSVA